MLQQVVDLPPSTNEAPKFFRLFTQRIHKESDSRDTRRPVWLAQAPLRLVGIDLGIDKQDFGGFLDAGLQVKIQIMSRPISSFDLNGMDPLS
jgi:hypothetical protein